MNSRLSKSIPHFAQIRFQDGKKYLWNPILKKKFINRPEERVRLELVEYFILEAGFSPHRLSFESPVNLPRDKSSSRTDIIAYDDKFKPLLLVECKSRDVVPNQISAIQLARYQQQINAPYTLLTNGIWDYWFDTSAEHTTSEPLRPLEDIPELFQPKFKVDRDFDYWQKRGFAGENSSEEVREFLLKSCTSLFVEPEHYVFFLRLNITAPHHYLENHYAIFDLEDGLKIAISFSATPAGETLLNVILNEGNMNRAFISASLDKISKGEKLNTEIHSEKNGLRIDLREEMDFKFELNVIDFISDFKEILLQYS